MLQALWSSVDNNIHSTDWVLFARAMSTLPDMIRARVSQVAKLRVLTGSLSYEQRQLILRSGSISGLTPSEYYSAGMVTHCPTPAETLASDTDL